MSQTSKNYVCPLKSAHKGSRTTLCHTAAPKASSARAPCHRPMGIIGLLDFVRPACEPDVHVGRFRGQYLAVDASGWLHRGAHSCSSDLAQDKHTERYLGFSLRMIALCREHGVELLFVFDGAPAVMKARTNALRAEQREAALAQGHQLLAEGHRTEASAAFGRAVRVTAAMRRRLIAALRKQRVAFVVAPYEADAQLAFLVRAGHCAAAISEDSDLLVYGCPCVLFKLDASGHGRLALFDNLRLAERDGVPLFDGAWPGEWQAWAETLLVDLAILAGCDYMSGVPGVGVKTAHALLREHQSLEACLSAALHKRGGLAATLAAGCSSGGGGARAHERAELLADLLDNANLVRQTFWHQLVYDPTSARVVPLRRDGAPRSRCFHLGEPIEAGLAHAICIDATVDAETLEDVSRLFEGLPPPAPLPPCASLPAPAQPLPPAAWSFASVAEVPATEAAAVEEAAGVAPAEVAAAMEAVEGERFQQPAEAPAPAAGTLKTDGDEHKYEHATQRGMLSTRTTTARLAAAVAPGGHEPARAAPAAPNEGRATTSRFFEAAAAAACDVGVPHGPSEASAAFSCFRNGVPVHGQAPPPRAPPQPPAQLPRPSPVPPLRGPARSLPFGDGLDSPQIVPQVAWVDLGHARSGSAGGSSQAVGDCSAISARKTSSGLRLRVSQVPSMTAGFLKRFRQGAPPPPR